MKLFQNQFEVDHPFSTTTIANWRKYPNDHAQQVIAVDVLDRTIDPSNPHILRTERLITCKQNVPWIIKKLGLPLPEVTYVREISELDLSAESYTSRSVNLSLNNLMTVEETCVLRPSKQSPLTSTEFTQSATITAIGCISSIARLVEEQAINRFKVNAQVGRLGLEQVLDKVAAEIRDAARKASSAADEFADEFKEKVEGFAKERVRSERAGAAI